MNKSYSPKNVTYCPLHDTIKIRYPLFISTFCHTVTLLSMCSVTMSHYVLHKSVTYTMSQHKSVKLSITKKIKIQTVNCASQGNFGWVEKKNQSFDGYLFNE